MMKYAALLKEIMTSLRRLFVMSWVKHLKMPKAMFGAVLKLLSKQPMHHH
jgi:hypothetical protein